MHRLSSLDQLIALDSEIKPYREVVESWLSQQEVFHGFCDRCCAVKPLQVNVGVWFGDRPSLREGLRCECGLSNRGRLMYSFVKRLLRSRQVSTACILEQQTSLFQHLSQLIPGLSGSEYFGPDFDPGSIHEKNGALIKHQDFCNLSYPTGSIELFIHNDVLEHVPDYRRAVWEAFRVPKQDGLMVFTCPFFRIPRTIVRAKYDPSGKLIHLRPPEYHGDSLRPEGILAYYNFGWDLIEDISAAGFAAVTVCVDYDVFRGLTSANYPEAEGTSELDRFGNMLPLLIEARKVA